MLKSLGKVGQWTGEKIGTYEATTIDEDFVELERYVDNLDTIAKNLVKSAEDLLQPNSTNRSRMKKEEKYKEKEKEKPTGENGKRYTQPESDLADVMINSSNQMSDSSYGQSLLLVGECENIIAESRYELDEIIMSNFVKNLNDFQNIEVKGSKSNKKRMEAARLEYDTAKRAHLKKPTDPKLETEYKGAQDRFEVAKSQLFNGIIKMNDDDGYRCQQLKDCVENQYTFHEKAAAILEPLIDKLYENLSEAVSRRKRDDYRTRKEAQEAGYCRIYVEALYDFEKENDYELAISVGDQIELLTELDDNWLEGTINGRTGLFPVSYIKYLD